MLQVKVGEATGIKKGGVEMVEKTYPTPEELHLGRATEVRGGGNAEGEGGWNSRGSRKSYRISYMNVKNCRQGWEQQPSVGWSSFSSS